MSAAGIEEDEGGDLRTASTGGEVARLASTAAGGRGGIGGGSSTTLEVLEVPVTPPVDAELVVVALGRSPSVACGGSPENGESMSTA